MDYYSAIVGVGKPFVPPTELKGIGDAPAVDGATFITHKPCGCVSFKCKEDRHASFPKGLPAVFPPTCLHEHDY